MARARVCLVAAIAAAYPVGANAQTAPTFAGKTVSVVVGWPPGSGNSFLGRIMAAHIGRHIPGQPQVVTQHMPGAGSLVAGNYLYEVAAKDGTVLGLITQASPTEELLGNPAIRFKTSRFNWIGRLSSYNLVTLTWHTTKVKSIADAIQHETTAGADSRGSTVYNYPNLMNRVLGTKFRLVLGYGGTAATALAMERGEVDGITTGWFTVKTARTDWLANKKVNILAQFVAERHADLPDVPTIVDLARTPEERQLFQLYANEGEIGKGLTSPPGMPEATVTVLRRAFDAMVADPVFIADSIKQKVELSPMSGEKLQELVTSVFKTPPAIVERAKALYQ